MRSVGLRHSMSEKLLYGGCVDAWPTKQLTTSNILISMYRASLICKLWQCSQSIGHLLSLRSHFGRVLAGLCLYRQNPPIVKQLPWLSFIDLHCIQKVSLVKLLLDSPPTSCIAYRHRPTAIHIKAWSTAESHCSCKRALFTDCTNQYKSCFANHFQTIFKWLDRLMPLGLSRSRQSLIGCPGGASMDDSQCSAVTMALEAKHSL